MKQIKACALALAMAGAVAVARAQNPELPVPNPNSQYRLGPDSMPQDGVPKGEIRGPFTLPSKVYAGTQHTYWIYVPAQYDPSIPASLMIFQDGQAMKAEEGDVRAQNVMDNLIYRREIPVMIGVFINPGRTPEQPEPTLKEWGDHTTNRPTEYNTPEGVQHFERSRTTWNRRGKLRRDSRVCGGLGASGRFSESAEYCR
jgi:enterochelin esterase family protein